jgi:hypothetical protein
MRVLIWIVIAFAWGLILTYLVPVVDPVMHAEYLTGEDWILAAIALGGDLLYAVTFFFLAIPSLRRSSAAGFFFGVAVSALVFSSCLATQYGFPKVSPEKALVFLVVTSGSGLLALWIARGGGLRAFAFLGLFWCIGAFTFFRDQPFIFYVYIGLVTMAIALIRFHREVTLHPGFLRPRWISRIRSGGNSSGMTYIEVMASLALLLVGCLISTGIVFKRGRIEQGAASAERAAIILEREMEKLVAQGAPPVGTDKRVPLSREQEGLQGAALHLKVTPFGSAGLRRVHLQVEWRNPSGGKNSIASERLFYTGGGI